MSQYLATEENMGDTAAPIEAIDLNFFLNL